MITICAKCKYRLIHHLAGTEKDIWYNNRCQASPEEVLIDYTTGNSITKSGDKYKYCREINPKGNCKLFEEKEYIGNGIERNTTKKS